MVMLQRGLELLDAKPWIRIQERKKRSTGFVTEQKSSFVQQCVASLAEPTPNLLFPILQKQNSTLKVAYFSKP